MRSCLFMIVTVLSILFTGGLLYSGQIRDGEMSELRPRMVDKFDSITFESLMRPPAYIENKNGLVEITNAWELGLFKTHARCDVGGRCYRAVLARGEMVTRTIVNNDSIGIFLPGNAGEFIIEARHETLRGFLLKEDYYIGESIVVLKNINPHARITIKITRAPANLK